MKLGVLSDLHLEGSNMDLDNPDWDCLIIPGDLSADLDLVSYFFAYKAPQIPIIYVMGNHEYEGRSLNGTKKLMKEIVSEFPHIHLLDNESVVIDGVKFIGSTLWSNFELDGMEQKIQHMNWARTNVVDFSAITYEREGLRTKLTPEHMVKLNEEAVKFLEFELKNNPFDGEKVVVTHFAPHPNSLAQEYRHKMSAYWVNNLEHLMGFSRYWFHGHTHNSFNYDVEGTQVVCNARGFSRLFNINANTSFDKQLSLQINEQVYDEVLKTHKNKFK